MRTSRTADRGMRPVSGITHISDPVERFERNDRLYPEDRGLLGDRRGQRVVHLQCSDGQDALCIAQHLGGELTGIDISEYPYMNGWERFPDMIEREPGRYYLPVTMPTLARMFSLTAVKLNSNRQSLADETS